MYFVSSGSIITFVLELENFWLEEEGPLTWQLMTQRDAMVAMKYAAPPVVVVVLRMPATRLAGTAEARAQSATSAGSPSEPASHRADPA